MSDICRNGLAMWTVYDHPHDYPEHYVARLWIADRDGVHTTASLLLSGELQTLRHVLEIDMHLICLTRNELDDPKIIETWL
jgi:hypothetical protein